MALTWGSALRITLLLLLMAAVVTACFTLPVKKSLQLLKAAIFDEECKPLFSLDIYGHMIGMFELNNLGLSASKLVLGLPFYGYAWKLLNPRDNGIGAPATGPAITKAGSMSCKDIKSYIQRYVADIIYNATYVVKYCIIGSSWIDFDDAQVVKIKVSYAKEQSLLGYFVWQVSHDDNWVLSLAAAVGEGK